MSDWEDVTPADPVLAGQVVIIDYRTWRGRKKRHRIIPEKIEFCATFRSPDPEWVLVAHDLEANKQRQFAMKNILEWRMAVDKV